MQTTIEQKKRGPANKPPYSPINLATARLNKRYASNYQQTQWGLEKRCSKCQEYWPADTEFFSPNNGGLHAHCKGCQAEKKRVNKCHE